MDGSHDLLEELSRSASSLQVSHVCHDEIQARLTCVTAAVSYTLGMRRQMAYVWSRSLMLFVRGAVETLAPVAHVWDNGPSITEAVGVMQSSTERIS